MSRRTKIRLCAKWLQACLALGWKKSDLDFLQTLWWTHKGWIYAAKVEQQ